MDKLVKRLRTAAELSRALVERDAVRKRSPSGKPTDVAARLKANQHVRTVARKLMG
ncbi:hypothetical protein PSP6_10140 [Paraburkholderia tropica]|uniref:hypothetical protein n=1 Tax=Paraburkholderia tropica TaxID=92647 RepID=UPI001CAADEB0|nr:hypothetical protein [Paraburkholderia tropica]CAG9189502.1 hypothetical protein PSP6_10140 [Paraburkholderia tropica]